MKLESAIQFIEAVWSYYHSPELSKPIKKRLRSILESIKNSWNNFNTERLVSIITENNNLRKSEDMEDYYELIELISSKVDTDLHHALMQASYERNMPWMVFDHMDRDNPSIKKWEIIAAKNYLQVNQYYINPLSQPIPKWHITWTEFCKYIQLSKIMNRIYEWRSYHQIYIQKIINCIIFIIWSNNDTENIFDSVWPWFDLCIPKEVFYNRIRELLKVQMDSIWNISEIPLNIDLLSTRINDIIKDLDIYLKNKENRYISEDERIEIETNELIEQDNANEETDGTTDRVNSLIQTGRDSSSKKRITINYIK